MNPRTTLAGALLVAALPALAQAPAPPFCDTPQQRQFDFWIGNFEVRTTDGRARRRWQSSGDDGETRAEAFDGYYRHVE